MTIPVFYDHRMVADSGSYSPSSMKPRFVVNDWLKRGLPITVLPPRAELPYVAHSRAYIDGVMAGTIDNGFGNRDPKVAATLPWTNGALLSAVEHVCTTGDRVAVAPAPGFHHAHWDYGRGFCTFNGLVAAAVRGAEYLKRAAILDCDFHYGDGTDAILTRGEFDDSVRHFTSGLRYDRQSMAKQFLSDLGGIIDKLVAGGVGVVIYQAGADQHIDDPLGGFLTTAEMLERDRIVFEALRHKRVVWTLAGGYQREADGSIPKVLELHRNTLMACLEVFGKVTT